MALQSITQLQRVHMVGIKGTGMSGLALVLAKLGITVTGSDAADSFLLLDQKNFDRAGIVIATPFDVKNITGDLDAVIVSTSHTTKNAEVLEAHRRKIPVLAYPEIVGMLTREFKSIAVCGSHGKTTTTNLLAHVLQTAGIPVLALAGPTSQQVIDDMTARGAVLSSKSLSEAEPLFIFEADEYQNKLAHYSPFGVILTNVELDHPDYFKTDAEYKKVFEDFIKKIPDGGFLIDGRKYPCELGRHREFNERLVTLAAKKLGLTDDQTKKGIASFSGSPRRMQKIDPSPRLRAIGTIVYDDYGHHPTEIRTTLRALREQYPDRDIWAVFHPHTYSRTEKFLKEFGAAFGDANHVIVLDIFESREVGKRTISSENVVAEIKKHDKDAHYCPTFAAAAALLNGKLSENTLLLTIGAGDVWKLHEYVIHRNRRAS